MNAIDNITELLSDYPYGLKAEEIASKLGIDAVSVRSLLYKDCKDMLLRDDEYRWKLNPDYAWEEAISTEKEHWLLKKFENKSGAKVFTLDDFNALADWKYGKSVSGSATSKYKTRAGNVIECDSESEVKLLKYLDRSDKFIAVGGQALTIPYDSEFVNNKNYNPDIVTLTNDGHIVIIEVKPVSSMSNHNNIEKYYGLKEYCEIKGFEYAMIDPQSDKLPFDDSDYMTFEQLKNLKIPRTICNLFVPLEKRTAVGSNSFFHFDKSDVEEWYKAHKNEFDRNEFDAYIHSLIINKGWFNTGKYGFDVYSRPVKYDDSHNVIAFK